MSFSSWLNQSWLKINKVTPQPLEQHAKRQCRRVDRLSNVHHLAYESFICVGPEVSRVRINDGGDFQQVLEEVQLRLHLPQTVLVTEP